ncbi:MAG TPA: hypothetical protein VN829_22940, partial [Dongiaceae bacterium]|nr:hypothetical protein [Dongiaceae bacterium]
PQPSRPTPAARLAGIVSIGGVRQAALELPARRRGSDARWVLLGEDQRDGDVTVLGINPANGTVRARLGGANEATLSLRNGTGLPAFEIVFEEAGLEPVLAVYQECVGRTLLRATLPVKAAFTLRTTATSQAQAAAVFERALAEQGIVAVPDGDKFMIVAPKEMEPELKARAIKRKSDVPGSVSAASAAAVSVDARAKPAPATGPSQEVIPAGMLEFRGADLPQVLLVYAELTGSKHRPGEGLPYRPQIHLKSQTPLTKEEAIYALDTVLRLGRIGVVTNEEGFLKAVALRPGEWYGAIPPGNQIERDREHLVPDLLIAAHAQSQAGRIAAIDGGCLRRYFPQLRVLQPRLA